MDLTGLQIFKYLPAAKKAAESNCKKCGYPTCMAFALKLAKKQADIEKCPFVPQELTEKFIESTKVQQHEIEISENLKTGGENVMFRHDKTFVNRTVLAIKLDTKDKDFESKLDEIKNFNITRVGETFKIDAIWLENPTEQAIEKINPIPILNSQNAKYKIISGSTIEELAQNSATSDAKQKILNLNIDKKSTAQVIEELTQIRRQAVINRYEPLTYPVLVKLTNKESSLNRTCALASMLICRYANVIVLDNFNPALLSTLLTLRQNIYTNPQKPLQVESKVYEFNEPDENSVVLMTTNFALTYFAVANELESMPFGSYLIVTPSDGMSVLTAWSADKFNAQIVAKMMSEIKLEKKVKNKEIIIPGLLSHMKEELEEALPQWKIIVGTIEAVQLYDFIKNREQNS